MNVDLFMETMVAAVRVVVIASDDNGSTITTVGITGNARPYFEVAPARVAPFVSVWLSDTCHTTRAVRWYADLPHAPEEPAQQVTASV